MCLFADGYFYQGAPPLKQRVFNSSIEHPLLFHPLHRAATYKNYESQSMSQAMKAVIEGGFSIRLAAEKFNIPRTTLGDRISGRVLPGSVSGPPKFLTDDEESELEGFIFHYASMGYGKTRKDVMAGGLHSVVVILKLYYEHLHYPEQGIWLRIRKFLINIIVLYLSFIYTKSQVKFSTLMNLVSLCFPRSSSTRACKLHG